MVDDRRVDLEDGRRTRPSRSDDALAPEVLVPFENDIWLDRAHEGQDAWSPGEPEPWGVERRGQGVPVHCAGREARLARSNEHVHLVPTRRQALGDRANVDRATPGP